MDSGKLRMFSRLRGWIDRPVSRRWTPVMMTLTILCVLATHAMIRYGSISSALAYAAGQRILIDASVKNFGSVEANKFTSLSYTLKNLTHRRITIQGAQSSCSCTVVDDVPCVIEAGASREIKLKIAMPSDKERIEGNISLYTDDRDTPVIVLAYEGNVVNAVMAGLGRDGLD